MENKETETAAFALNSFFFAVSLNCYRARHAYCSVRFDFFSVAHACSVAFATEKKGFRVDDVFSLSFRIHIAFQLVKQN